MGPGGGRCGTRSLVGLGDEDAPAAQAGWQARFLPALVAARAERNGAEEAAAAANLALHADASIHQLDQAGADG